MLKPSFCTSMKEGLSSPPPSPFPHALWKYKSHGILHLWLIVSILKMCFFLFLPFSLLWPPYPHSSFLSFSFHLILSFLLCPSPSVPPSSLLPRLLQTDWFQMFLNSLCELLHLCFSSLFTVALTQSTIWWWGDNFGLCGAAAAEGFLPFFFASVYALVLSMKHKLSA